MHICLHVFLWGLCGCQNPRYYIIFALSCYICVVMRPVHYSLRLSEGLRQAAHILCSWIQSIQSGLKGKNGLKLFGKCKFNYKGHQFFSE